MKLLIVTQAVDVHDPILSFFLSWLRTFAGEVEQVTVIAQSVGDYALPANVKVISLGKDSGKSKLSQIRRFLSLISLHRTEYDAVLVHMTPVWVVLGGMFWKLQKKRIYLWYEIRRGSRKLSLALRFVDKVFSASPSGLPSVSKKNVVLGHGIDTDEFCPPRGPRDYDLVCTVGRVTRVKHHDVLLRAFAKLPTRTRYVLGGGPITEQDQRTLAQIRSLLQELRLEARVRMGFLTRSEVVSLFQRASLMLHACHGGLDKVVLEAMACECLVVSSSQAAAHVLPPACQATDATLAEVAAGLLSLTPAEQDGLRFELRRRVIAQHSLYPLILRMVREMS